MTDKKNSKKLLQRISQLEQEIKDREQDLARFRTELTSVNQRIETLIDQFGQELTVIETLQRILVPTELPQFSGLEFSTKFLPSEISGGDYYDIFSHDDPMHFGLVVASSSGYATSALFMSVLLKISERMEARRGSLPHEILNAMANDLVKGLSGNGKIDIFYSFIDRRTFDLHYCRLGDIFVGIQDAQSQQLKSILSSGESLDKHFVKLAESKKISLSPGDRIIICTRGIMETMNPSREAFGQERIFKAILKSPKRGVHELRNQILYDVEKFAAQIPLQRDQIVIVAEVKDRVIKLARN